MSLMFGGLREEVERVAEKLMGGNWERDERGRRKAKANVASVRPRHLHAQCVVLVRFVASTSYFPVLWPFQIAPFVVKSFWECGGLRAVLLVVRPTRLDSNARYKPGGRYIRKLVERAGWRM